MNFDLRIRPQGAEPQQQGRADISLYGTFYFDDEKDFDSAATVSGVCSHHIGEVAALIDQCEEHASGPLF